MPQLQGMIEKARVSNLSNDITGLLIKLEGGYIQYVEGHKNHIVMLYEKLLRDERHHSLELLKRGNIEKRRFGKWSMLFQNVTKEQIRDIEKRKNRNSNFRFLRDNNVAASTQLALTLISKFELGN